MSAGPRAWKWSVVYRWVCVPTGPRPKWNERRLSANKTGYKSDDGDDAEDDIANFLRSVGRWDFFTQLPKCYRKNRLMLLLRKTFVKRKKWKETENYLTIIIWLKSFTFLSCVTKNKIHYIFLVTSCCSSSQQKLVLHLNYNNIFLKFVAFHYALF